MKMQNKMKLTAIATAILGSHGAYAVVTDMGNGGHAIVCRDPGGKITSAQLLDYSDSADFKGTVDFGPGTTTVREKVQAGLSRIGKFSPAFAGYLASNAEPLLVAAEAGKSTDIVQFEDDKTLTFIPDSFHFTTPVGCTDEQLAIRTVPGENPALGPTEYLIQQGIWSALDANNQAGLILHEVLYKYAVIARGQTDSVKTRYVNQVVSSDWIDLMSSADFLDVLKKAGFSSKVYFTVAFDDKGADVQVTVAGQTCSLATSQLTFDSYVGGLYGVCPFDIIPGQGDYSLDIQKGSGASDMSYWLLSDEKDSGINNATWRSILAGYWFWKSPYAASVPNSGQHTRIDPAHPLTAAGKITSGLPQ